MVNIMTRIQVNDQRPMGPLVLSINSHMKMTSGLLVYLKGAVCTRIRSRTCAADTGIIVRLL